MSQARRDFLITPEGVVFDPSALQDARPPNARVPLEVLVEESERNAALELLTPPLTLGRRRTFSDRGKGKIGDMNRVYFHPSKHRGSLIGKGKSIAESKHDMKSVESESHDIRPLQICPFFAKFS